MTAQLHLFGAPVRVAGNLPETPWVPCALPEMHSGPCAPAAARDATLAALAERRAVLVQHATRVALELCARDGCVTAPRVLAEMRRRGLHDEAADARYLGAVLLPSKGWRRTGELVGEGSKCRPVPVWVRA